MAKQDKTGTKYEKLLVASLRYLGYVNDTDSGLNYLNIGKKSRDIVIPNTYIQPDIIVRNGTEIKAILYVTHWSKQRNCAFKFWRTWEELAQQKIVIANDFLGINCLFEALPTDLEPSLYLNSDDLPIDIVRGKQFPIGFKGWYPGTSWALTESFDVSIVFPFGYHLIHDSSNILDRDDDPVTTNLLERALFSVTKLYLQSQWITLLSLKESRVSQLSQLTNTESRYRIGLLHVYIFYRILSYLLQDNTPTIADFLIGVCQFSQGFINLQSLVNLKEFSNIKLQSLLNVFEVLSQVYVRMGKDGETFCELSSFSNPHTEEILYKVKLNNDLYLCLNDLRHHIEVEGFTAVVERTFATFDKAYLINEVFEDIANIDLVRNKASFVRSHFFAYLHDANKLYELISLHGQKISPARAEVSNHSQNWVLEMLLYLANINVAEDIYPIISPVFEESGYLLRPHAPMSDDTALVVYMLQGRDVYQGWSNKKRGIKLTPEQFRDLSWEAIAKCIVRIFQDRANVAASLEVIVRKYLMNKSMRIIGSGLSGFHIMIEQYLGDLCHLVFVNSEDELEEKAQNRFSGWHTNIIDSLYNATPLQTRLEGTSRNGNWLIKVQSAQDGNEGHKTKELAGRCRALRLAWSHGQDPRDRTQWTFSERPLPKLALVLDGDWEANKKRNLYEAGWDWVGDVAQLGELRRLIQQDG